MFFNNLFHNGQAQATAPGLGGNVGFENAVQLFRLETGAIVIDTKLDITMAGLLAEAS